MEKNAAAVMGEPVIAGALVLPKGFSKKNAIGMGVGGVIGAAVATAMGSGAATTPGGHHGRLFIALSPTKLAFFEAKSGLLKVKLGRLLHEAPRSSVTAFDAGGGALVAPLHIVLADGAVYELETPRASRKRIARIANELGAAPGAQQSA